MIAGMRGISSFCMAKFWFGFLNRSRETGAVNATLADEATKRADAATALRRVRPSRAKDAKWILR